MRKNKKYFTSSKKYIAFVLAVSLMFGVLLPVSKTNAQESTLSTQATQSIEQMLTLGDTLTELDDTELANVQDVFFIDLEHDNFIVQVAKENLDIDNLTVLELLDVEDAFISVVVPIIGEDYNQLSNITIIYDLNLNILTYQETIVTESIQGTFEFTSYIDGQMVRSDVTELEFVSNEEFEESLEALRMAFSNPNVRNGACIAAVLGIGVVAGTAIYLMCVGSCVAVVTIKICVACIGATAVLGGASMTAVVACFGL